MADQTVRTIYQANVAQAQRSMTSLAKDTDRAADSVDKLDKGLDSAGKKSVKPKIDVDIAKAEAEVRKFTSELEQLEKTDASPTVTASTESLQAKLEDAEQDLDALNRLEATPEVVADIGRAEIALAEIQNRLDMVENMDAEVEVGADTDRARADLADAEAKLKALQGAKAEMVVTVDADSVEDSFDGVGDAAEEAGDDAGARAGNALIEGLNSTPVVGAISGIVIAAGGFIVSGVIGAIQDALRVEDVFGAATGFDEATSRKFGAAAGAAYGNAWGESVEANLDTARRALENGLIDEDSTGREVQVVTEQLTALAEIMDVDVMEAAEAAGNMIKNGLAGNATEAFDVILAGQQDGLNRSEDWLDTLREYSPMFQALGLDGAEAGGLIAQGMEAGARNSDIMADSLKELSIRAVDGSDSTKEAFAAIGEDADDMGARFAAGGDSAKEALQVVLDGVRGLDKEQRQVVGTKLFGTQWEDAGLGAALLALDLEALGDTWVNVGDTTADAMTRMSDNAATAWESIKRNITNAATQTLAGIASVFEDPVTDLSAWVSTHTAEILGFLIDLGSGFFDLARAATEFAATTIENLGEVAGGMDVIVDGTGRAVEALGHLTGDQGLVDLGQGIQESADSMTEFSESADGMADTLRTNVNGALDEAEAKFQSWTGPALMQAEINDAIAVMVQDLDGFVAYVDELPGGTITINGDTTGGEEAMNTLIEEVSASNGTVNINGETVDAEDALQHVKDLAAEGAEITVTANTGPSEAQIAALIQGLNDSTQAGVVQVDADTAPAAESVDVFKGKTTETTATVGVSANIEPAQMDVVNLENTIAASGGTVTINGNSTPGDQVLDTLMAIINSSDGTVTIDGNEVPADQALSAAITAINNGRGTVTINGNASDAESKANHAARDRSSTIDVNANTYGANAAINAAARTRTAYVNVVATGAVSALRAGVRGIGNATGGVVGAGLAGGGTVGSGYGTVPAPAAPWGVDNVLWPTSIGLAGGGTLNQPLAGGEWVVNPISSKQHDATLRAINAGATRAELAASLGGSGGGRSMTYSPSIYGPDATVVEAKAFQSFQHWTETESTGTRGA